MNNKYIKVTLVMSLILMFYQPVLFGQGTTFESVGFIESNFDRDSLNQHNFVSFLDFIEFRTKAIFNEDEIPDNTLITDEIFHIYDNGMDITYYVNETPQVNNCDSIIIPSNDSGSQCWTNDSTGKIYLPLKYGANTITFSTFIDENDYLDSPDTLFVFHPMPQVIAGSYNEISPDIIIPGTTEPVQFFDSAVFFQAELNINDEFSFGDTIKMQVYLNDSLINDFDTVSNGLEPITIPADIYDNCIVLPDYEPDTIYYKAYFESHKDSVELDFVSDSLFVQRVKPKIDSMAYLSKYPANLSTESWNIIYTDSIEFRTKLFYNDSINSGDIIKVTAIRETFSEGAPERIDSVYQETVTFDPDNPFIIIPHPGSARINIPLDDRYDSILVHFEANFIRPGLDSAEVFKSKLIDSTLKIIHPAPTVEEVLYDTSILQPSNVDIEPETPVTVFDNKVQVRMQINYLDTCSVGDSIYLQPYYNGNPIGEEPLNDTTRFWGEGNIKIPRTEYSLYDIPIDYGEFENDWDTIHFEAYFTKTPDSVVSSERLLIFREKPIITSFDYVQQEPTYLSTTSWDSIYQDKVKFQVQLNYNDNLIQGDSIKTVIYREVNGGEPVVIEETTLLKPSDGNPLILPNENEKYIVETDPFFDDSIRVYFESWFIRGDLPDPDTCNKNGDVALLIFHPKPKADTVTFAVTDPDDLIIGDTTENKFIYDDTIKFRANVHYKDTFSLDEQIWVQAKRIYENNPPQEIGEKRRITSGNANNIEIPTPDSLFADTIGYNFGSYKYYMDAWFYLHDTISLDIVPSDTLYLFHPKPLVDTVMFELIEPDDLVIGQPGANPEVYEDIITFRADVNYNDPLSLNETIKARVMKVYNGDTIQQGQILQGTTLEGNDITIPASPEVFDVFLGYEFGDHEIYIEAWFDLDGLEKDTITSSSIYLYHPKPAVNTVTFNEVTIPEGNTFCPLVEFNTLVNINDALSDQEIIKIEVYKKGNLLNLPPDLTEITTDGSGTSYPIPETVRIPVELDYGLNEIYVDAFFLEWYPENIVSSETLTYNRIKPEVTAHDFVDDTPEIIEGEVNNFYEDYIDFRLNLNYNDDCNSGDQVEVKCQMIVADTVAQEIIKYSITDENQQTIKIPSEVSGEFFHFDLDPYYNTNIEIRFEAKFIRDGLENPPLYDNFNNPVIIYHPKPIINEITFEELDPEELTGYFNTEIEIYNPEISFKTEVCWNDELSDNEIIKMEIHHEVNGGEPIIYSDETLTNSGQTCHPFPEEYILDITSGNDFGQHIIFIKAWFELPDQDIDYVYSDSILLTYRENTQPIVEITTPYDEIYIIDTVEIEGIVTDSTGKINKHQLWVQINGQDSVTATVNQDQSIQQDFTATVFLDKPINSVFAWARDTVPFTNEEELFSVRDSIRVNYVFFDTDTVFLPENINKQFIAFPPGGEFGSEDISINKAGIFIPADQDTGVYEITYKYTTPYNATGKTISKEIEILGAGTLTGNASVCKNGYVEYSYESTNSQSDQVDWKVTGGLINEFNVTNNSIEAKWLEGGSSGKVEVTRTNTSSGQAIVKEQITAINNREALPKAQVVRKGNIFFCSIDTNAFYQWKRNGSDIDGETNAYYYCENHASNDSATYFSVDVWQCDDCNEKCITNSYNIFNFDESCFECDSPSPENLGDSFVAEGAFTDVLINEATIKILKLSLINETSGSQNRLIMDLSRGTDNPFSDYTLRLKGLTEGNTYKVSIDN